MGLDIHVGKKHMYSHSYGSLHILRRFAAQLEYPNEKIEDTEDIYKHGYSRFPTLIWHSDCDGGYVPNGVKIPDGGDSRNSPAFNWPRSEDLLAELLDLGKHKPDMNHTEQMLYDEMLAIAKESVRRRVIIHFG